MNRILLTAAIALVMPTSAAIAQTLVPAGPGAIAGRSPHPAFRIATPADLSLARSADKAARQPSYSVQAAADTTGKAAQVATADPAASTSQD